MQINLRFSYKWNISLTDLTPHAANALDDYEEGIFSFTRKGHAGAF